MVADPVCSNVAIYETYFDKVSGNKPSYSELDANAGPCFRLPKKSTH